MRSDLNGAMLRAVQPPPKDRLELLDSAVSGWALPLTVTRVATSAVRTRLPDLQRVSTRLLASGPRKASWQRGNGGRC